MSTELPDRTVIGNIWNVGPDNGVVTYSSRFSKPGRRRPRLSDEVVDNRAADIEWAVRSGERYAHDDKRVLGWCCLASAVVAILVGVWLTWIGGGF